MPKIDEALFNLPPDYSQAEVPELGEGLPAGYWKSWFRRKADNFLSYLQVYAYIISMAVPESKSDLADLRLLDFAGGWGLMSMLAKEAGIGHVTYLDIDAGVTNCTKVVSDVLGLPLDTYICGSETALLTRHNDRFDSVVSSDALEHVYGVGSVFKAISYACSPGAFVFHHTGANPKSPYQRLKLMRLHQRHETEDSRELNKLHAEGGRAIWEERKEFIQSYAPQLKGPVLDRLVRSNRGLNRSDLQQAIDACLDMGTFPTPSHPTNTCKLSGYWLERLMDLYDVAQKLAENGFRAQLARTFWGPGRSNFTKRLIKHGLNLVSNLSVGTSMKVSFYLQGVKQ